MQDCDEISYSVHSSEDSKGWALAVTCETSPLDMEEFIAAVKSWLEDQPQENH